MRIGFTGSEKGMTSYQVKEVAKLLNSLSEITETHHGDCIGSDALFNDMVGWRGIRPRIAHPASDTGNKRAYCQVEIILPAKPALRRNHDIVDSVDLMIATPAQDHEVLRSGTWATIRYAKKIGKIIHVIYPGK